MAPDPHRRLLACKLNLQQGTEMRVGRVVKESLAKSFVIQIAWLPVWPAPTPSSKRRVNELAPLGGYFLKIHTKTTSPLISQRLVCRE